MHLLACLGNPGAQYAHTRHNIGFMLGDGVAKTYGFGAWQSKFGGLLADGIVHGKRALVFKPQSYMNLSGGPVGELSRFYKIEPGHIIAVHDDLDLALGKVRVKLGGGHGGHNGLKSLDEHLGQDYWRLRLGIGHPGERSQVTSHVLHDFYAEEKPVVEHMLRACTEHLPLLLAQDGAGFLNKIALAKK